MRAIVTLMCVLAVVSCAASTWALNDRLEQSVVTRQRIAAASLFNCREIETLKAAQRADAWKAWHDLDLTLRLLHLKKTQEIVRVARANRDDRLRTFKADPCPRRTA